MSRYVVTLTLEVRAIAESEAERIAELAAQVIRNEVVAFGGRVTVIGRPCQLIESHRDPEARTTGTLEGGAGVPRGSLGPDR